MTRGALPLASFRELIITIFCCVSGFYTSIEFLSILISYLALTEQMVFRKWITYVALSPLPPIQLPEEITWSIHLKSNRAAEVFSEVYSRSLWLSWTIQKAMSLTGAGSTANMNHSRRTWSDYKQCSICKSNLLSGMVQSNFTLCSLKCIDRIIKFLFASWLDHRFLLNGEDQKSVCPSTLTGIWGR